MDNNNRRKLSVSNIVLIIACALIVCILGTGTFLVIREANRTENTLTEYAGVNGDDDFEVDTSEPETPETFPTETVTEAVTTTTAVTTAEYEPITIRLMSYNDVVLNMVNKYYEVYPERAAQVKFETTKIEYTTELFKPTLDSTPATETNVPDIYSVHVDYVDKYARGNLSQYAAAYKDLGIDVDNLLEAADIAPYSVEYGRNNDGEIIGLDYENNAGVFIYRRSMAIDTWGTDDPDAIAQKIKDWDSFIDSALELKDKGYYTTTIHDLWRAYSFGADKGWVDGTELYIDPVREGFLDVAKPLYQGGCITDTRPWTDEWYDSMNGTEPVFGFFGPAWFLTYTLYENCGETFGDWAVCAPTEEFFWGGSWLMVNKAVLEQSSPEKIKAIADFIEWVTLDSTETGLQYFFASGGFRDDFTPDTPTSGIVMNNVDGSAALIGGQDMFMVFGERSGGNSSVYNGTYDSSVNARWLEEVRYYAFDMKTREEAINEFTYAVTEYVLRN